MLCLLNKWDLLFKNSISLHVVPVIWSKNLLLQNSFIDLLNLLPINTLLHIVIQTFLILQVAAKVQLKKKLDLQEERLH